VEAHGKLIGIDLPGLAAIGSSSARQFLFGVPVIACRPDSLPGSAGLMMRGGADVYMWTFTVTEIPKDPTSTRFRAGDHGSSVRCKNCGFKIPIGGNLSKLPEMFEAKCRTCGETRIYRSGEIQALAAAPKQ
jgi:predicted RNA-binding Zn-ribbon protein involved in translation (DUF1610 family)